VPHWCIHHAAVEFAAQRTGGEPSFPASIFSGDVHHQFRMRRDAMGKHVVLGALAVCAMTVTSVAWAARPAFSGQVTLVNAVAAPAELVVEGVTWRCEGANCVGTAQSRSSLNSFIKDCREVSEAVGPVTAFKAKGRTATKGEIDTCNRLAGK
jgi:hypothetical protein